MLELFKKSSVSLEPQSCFREKVTWELPLGIQLPFETHTACPELASLFTVLRKMGMKNAKETNWNECFHALGLFSSEGHTDTQGVSAQKRKTLSSCLQVSMEERASWWVTVKEKGWEFRIRRLDLQSRRSYKWEKRWLMGWEFFGNLGEWQASFLVTQKCRG